MDALPPCWKSPTRAIANCCLNLVWLIELEMFFLQPTTHKMYVFNTDTSIPQNNNFCHHLSLSKEAICCHVLICSIHFTLVLHEIYNYTWLLYNFFFYFPSYSHPDRIWHGCAEHCHQKSYHASNRMLSSFLYDTFHLFLDLVISWEQEHLSYSWQFQSCATWPSLAHWQV